MQKIKNDISVSVIIPVYNMERHLCECLDSVLSQSLKNIEVICIDDGSSDNSLAILNAYQAKYNNIVILKQNHLGAGAARNYGMAEANGQFVSFMDSDDFYPNGNTLARLYDVAMGNEVFAVRGSFSTYKEGEVIESFEGNNAKRRCNKEGFVKFSEFQWCMGFTTYLFDLNFLRQNGIVFPRYKRNEDPPFCAEALSKIEIIYTIPDTVYVARVTDKRIVYNDELLCDIAQGFCDIISLAVKNNYSVLLQDISERMHKMDSYFDFSVYNGNFKLAQILETIEFLQLNFRMRLQSDYEKTFFETVSKYKNIIIYGAGERGKEVYDFISDNSLDINIEFAITRLKQYDFSARGKKVHEIASFISCAKDVLVIVAALQEKMRREMLDYAKDLGFESVITLDRPLLGCN